MTCVAVPHTRIGNNEINDNSPKEHQFLPSFGDIKHKIINAVKGVDFKKNNQPTQLALPEPSATGMSSGFTKDLDVFSSTMTQTEVSSSVPISETPSTSISMTESTFLSSIPMESLRQPGSTSSGITGSSFNSSTLSQPTTSQANSISSRSTTVSTVNTIPSTHTPTTVPLPQEWVSLIQTKEVVATKLPIEYVTKTVIRLVTAEKPLIVEKTITHYSLISPSLITAAPTPNLKTSPTPSTALALQYMTDPFPSVTMGPMAQTTMGPMAQTTVESMAQAITTQTERRQAEATQSVDYHFQQKVHDYVQLLEKKLGSLYSDIEVLKLQAGKTTTVFETPTPTRMFDSLPLPEIVPTASKDPEKRPEIHGNGAKEIVNMKPLPYKVDIAPQFQEHTSSVIRPQIYAKPKISYNLGPEIVPPAFAAGANKELQSETGSSKEIPDLLYNEQARNVDTHMMYITKILEKLDSLADGVGEKSKSEIIKDTVKDITKNLKENAKGKVSDMKEKVSEESSKVTENLKGSVHDKMKTMKEKTSENDSLSKMKETVKAKLETIQDKENDIKKKAELVRKIKQEATARAKGLVQKEDLKPEKLELEIVEADDIPIEMEGELEELEESDDWNESELESENSNGAEVEEVEDSVGPFQTFKSKAELNENYRKQQTAKQAKTTRTSPSHSTSGIIANTARPQEIPHFKKITRKKRPHQFGGHHSKKHPENSWKLKLFGFNSSSSKLQIAWCVVVVGVLLPLL